MDEQIDVDVTPNRTKLLMIVFGLMVSLGLAWHQYLLFIKAFLSPQKAVVLYIDVFGEANSEMILLTISMILGTMATAYILWCIRKGKRIVC
jgi:hypothetical protein